MKIAFYSSRLSFNGDSLESIGNIGGSEAALINITTCWKKQFPDDEVVIFNGNNIDNKEYKGVKYKSLIEFRNDIIINRWDVFISLRELFPFKLPYINAKLKIFWSQDYMADSNIKIPWLRDYASEPDLIKLENDMYARANIDLFFVISNYAKDSIQKHFPEKELLLQRNGYRSDWIQDTKNIDETNPICLYGSTPFRGLEVLATCWTEIYNKCRMNGVNPILKVCTGMSLYQQPEGNFIQLYNYLKSLPGVNFVGALPQKEVYKELHKSKVLLYPNTFLESGCMIVLESLANSLWVVTSDLGALSEQVKDNINGYLIKGDAYSKEYQKEFIEKSVYSLCNNLIPYNDGLIFNWDEQTKLMRNNINERI